MYNVQPLGCPRAVVFWLRFAHLFASSCTRSIPLICASRYAATQRQKASHEPGLPAHLSQQVGRTVEPLSAVRYTTARQAWLRTPAIPLRIPQAPQFPFRSRRDGLEPRVPLEQERAEYRGGAGGGDKFWRRHLPDWLADPQSLSPRPRSRGPGWRGARCDGECRLPQPASSHFPQNAW